MADISGLAAKVGITSPRVLRKAKEFCQLVDIRSSSTSLSSLKLTGSSKAIACIELAATSCNHYVDKSAVVKASGTTKKLYTMCLKTIESILEVQDVKTVRDLAVQFGCTGAVSLAQQVLQSYERAQGVRGEEMDFNTSLFQGAALCAACRKLKIKVDRGKVKEMCAVKKSCFDTLVADMEKIADSIEGEKKVAAKKRTGTLMDEVEKYMQEIPEKHSKKTDTEEEENQVTDFEEWKRKILENAAKAAKNS